MIAFVWKDGNGKDQHIVIHDEDFHYLSFVRGDGPGPLDIRVVKESDAPEFRIVTLNDCVVKPLAPDVILVRSADKNITELQKGIDKKFQSHKFHIELSVDQAAALFDNIVEEAEE